MNINSRDYWSPAPSQIEQGHGFLWTAIVRSKTGSEYPVGHGATEQEADDLACEQADLMNRTSGYRDQDSAASFGILVATVTATLLLALSACARF